MGNENPQAAVGGTDKLDKALAHLDQLAKSAADEKADLLQKAMGGDISPEQNARLLQLLAGQAGQQVDSLAKSATAGLQPAAAPGIRQGVEVSPYLHEHLSGTLGALEVLADNIEKSSSTQTEFNMVLAKAVHQIGTVMKSLRDEVRGFAGQTVEQPRGVATQREAAARAAGGGLNKSFANQPGAGEDVIQKGEVLNLLEEMHIDSIKKGGQGLAKCGEDLNKSIAKYEQTGKMTQNLVNEMKAYRAARRAVA